MKEGDLRVAFFLSSGAWAGVDPDMTIEALRSR
jgi:hypothetical protein